MAVDAEYVPAYVHLGSIYETQGRDDDALVVYRTALGIAPNSAWVRSVLDRVCLRTVKPAEALAHLRRAVELDPGNITRLLNLGYAFPTLGQLDRAVAIYRQVLSLDPINQQAIEALSSLTP
jgi:tetratricopeptide (TPR) repeat protein